MLDFKVLRQEWNELTSYERFEQVISRIIMAFVAVVIVYSVVLTAIELALDFTLGRAFMEHELLQDVFGSILTILILLEFNHSIAISLKRKTGIVQTRIVVLIGILVIVRKIILLDFKTASIEALAGHAGVALALGALYWLIVASSHYGGASHDGQRRRRAKIRPAGTRCLLRNRLLRPGLRGHGRRIRTDQVVQRRLPVATQRVG